MITIVLSSCFINLYASDYCCCEEDDFFPSTGEVVIPSDSVLISYDDLRIVNSKLTELKYEKEINIKLREVVDNDKIIINNYKALNDNINKSYKNMKLQRNIFIGTSAFVLLATTLLIIFR